MCGTVIPHLPPAADPEEPQYLRGGVVGGGGWDGTRRNTLLNPPAAQGCPRCPRALPQRAMLPLLDWTLGREETPGPQNTEYKFSGSEKEFQDSVKSSGAAACSPFSLFPDRALQEGAALLCQGEVAAGTWPAEAASQGRDLLKDRTPSLARTVNAKTFPRSGFQGPL